MIATSGRDDSLDAGSLELEAFGVDEAATYLERAGRGVILVLYPDLRANSCR